MTRPRMDQKRWQVINDLYNSALKRKQDDRGAFIAEASRGDEELQRDAEALLAANDNAGDFLDSPAIEVVAKRIAEGHGGSVIGKEIGHYQVMSLLGMGGMGEVYLAKDRRLGRQIALKLLPQEFTQDRERVARFGQEARAASSLNHPNIITIFEISESEGSHFIVTEFIDGQTLRQRMLASMLKIGEALDIGSQVAGALVAAHEAGIVHRDIKAENVMIRTDGYVKGLDFGLAKLTEPQHEGAEGDVSANDTSARITKTDPGRVMGTTRSMSPEQVLGYEVDGRSDIFSLAVVLYEMLAGRGPFEAGSDGEIFSAILNLDVPPPGLSRPEVPRELDRIVAKALAKKRDQRYQLVNDLFIDLKNLRSELELEAKLKQVGEWRAKVSISGERPAAAPAADPPSPSQPQPTPVSSELEPVGGAMALDSEYYIARPTDLEFHNAIARQDSIVLVKGPRQVGKTSLLARGLQKAREAGSQVVLCDFQNLASASLGSSEELFQTMADLIVDELDLDVIPADNWNPRLSPGINFERFLRRQVFAKVSSPIVWGLDEVDWLFTTSFSSEVFGLFRSWHNKRALDPSGSWQRLTLAIAYATEAHLFISDLNQSPFNVGTRLTLEDFTHEQVEELNRRYGSPLRNNAELARYYRLVGGNPYLVRCGLNEMVGHGLDLAGLESLAEQEEGPFGDHLRRLLVSLNQDDSLRDVVRGVLQGQPCSTTESFYRLRSAGVMAGESAMSVKPRCQLYARFLERHML